MNQVITPAFFAVTKRVQILHACFVLFAAMLCAATMNAQLFETTFGAFNNQEEAQDSKPVPGNSYIVLANTQSFGPASMISLTRLNASGAVEFTSTLHDPNNPTVPYYGAAIELDYSATGTHIGYFIAGHRTVQSGSQIVLIRTNLQGALLWLKVLPAAPQHNERAVSVERQANGDVTVVGSSIHVNTGVSAFTAARFSSAGGQIWSNRYTGGSSAGANSVEALEATNGFRGNNPSIAVTGRAGNRTFLSLINAVTGDEIWRRLYNSGLGRDEGADVVYKPANGPGEPAAFMIVGSAGAPHSIMWVVRVNPIDGAGNSKTYQPDINFTNFSATAVTLDMTGTRAAVAGKLLMQSGPASFTNVVFAMVLPFYGTELPEWTRYYEGSNFSGPAKESISRITSGGYFIGSGARLSGAATPDLHAIRVNATGDNGLQSCSTRKFSPTRTATGTTQSIQGTKTSTAWTNYVLTRTQRIFRQENCGSSTSSLGN